MYGMANLIDPTIEIFYTFIHRLRLNLKLKKIFFKNLI